jgi:hypothetical protein
MSAVVSAVKSVAKAVGKTVERVGDAVEKVAEVVVDTVKYVAENPEILVIAIAVPYAVGAAGAAIGTQAAVQTASLLSQPITAAAITASQGGDIEDIGKAALGSFIGQPVGQFVGAKTGAAIGAQNAAQVALSNAVGGAAGSAVGAAVMGTDVGEAAKLGAIGSAGASVARSGATSLGADQTGKAAGYTADIGEALARGAVTGDIAGELVGAGVGALIGEGQQALDEITTPTVKDATAYYPPISPEMAALTGSTIDGSPVTDVSIISGLPESAKMFAEGDMVIPNNAKTGTPYTVKNEQGETFQARDLTYQDGSVQRIIFDPNTQQYQQQVLRQSSADVGGDRVLPEITATGGQSGILANPDPDIRTGRVTDIAGAATGGRESTAPAGGATTATTPAAGPETGGAAAGGRGEGEMVGDGEREMAGGTRPIEDMTGTELLGDAMAGEEAGTPREGGEGAGEGGRGGEGGGGGEGAGEGGGGGEGLAEQPADLEAMTDEELLALLEDSMDFDVEETPLVPPDATGEGFQPLDVRTARGSRTGTPYQSSISPRVVGSSPTAAIVGDKEPIFGGDEGVQSEAWNTRSLRLRKALGL